MATWTDGAAYAPLERPDGFATPEAAPLEVRGPQLAQTPGAIPPPQGFAPTAPQIPLEQIRTTPPPSRNPAEPFRTASATLTAGPDFHVAGERDPREPFPSYSTTVGSQELPPPSGPPLPPPTGAPLAAPAGFASQGGVPGLTSQPVWSPPGASTGPDPRTMTTLLGIASACMFLGALLPGAASWLILIGGLLMLRTKPVSGQLGLSSVIGGVVLLAGTLFEPAFEAVASLAAAVFGILAIYFLVRSRSSR